MDTYYAFFIFRIKIIDSSISAIFPMSIYFGCALAASIKIVQCTFTFHFIYPSKSRFVCLEILKGGVADFEVGVRI